MTVKELIINNITHRDINILAFDAWIKAHNHSLIDVTFRKEGIVRNNVYIKEIYNILCSCDCRNDYTLILEYKVKPQVFGVIMFYS